jgi:hypothetical protein
MNSILMNDQPTQISIDLPEARWFRQASISLEIFSHIYATEWRAVLGYDDRRQAITRSVFSTTPTPQKSLLDLRRLCEGITCKN